MATHAGERKFTEISKTPNVRLISPKSLLMLCIESSVGHIDKLLIKVPNLPRQLKAAILHLMSKRHNLLTDQNIHLVCSDAVRELDFTNTRLISDAGILSLPHLPNLFKIDLNDTRTGTRTNVSSASLKHIASRCPRLRLAYFRRCILVCDEGIRALAEGCKYLQEVNLSGCPLITDVSISAIAKHCHYLQSINLAYTSITDDSGYYLAQSACAPKLQEVQISHCKYITDECVEAILSGGANISSFEIQGCPMLTDNSLNALEQLRSKFNLKQFNFTIMF